MRKLRTIEMNRLTLEEFKEAEKLPLIVVLDDVRSLYNVGSVFRSCDAFRVEAVYLCGITATPPNEEAEKLPLIVVLDDVRSLYNVGSVFRSCDAFRVEAVYLCGITATPPNAEIHKTALGGEDSVDWEYFKTTEEAVEKLKQKGYFVYSIEQVEGSTKLQNLPEAHDKLFNQEIESVKQENSSLFTLHSSLPKGYAVIFGNEVKGVKQNIVDMSDGCLEIPQFGTKHSLNVSVTAGIVVWEFAKLLKL